MKDTLFISNRRFYLNALEEEIKAIDNLPLNDLEKVRAKIRYKMNLIKHLNNTVERQNTSLLGKTNTDIKTIYLSLNNLKRYFKDELFLDRVCKTISHEVIHNVLKEQNELIANIKWDIICNTLKDYGVF